MWNLNKRKIDKLKGYLFRSPAFLKEADEGFLEKFTSSEWKEYELWLFRNRHFSVNNLRKMYKKARGFKTRPKISIIMPVYNPDTLEFKHTIDSILWQAYPYWELCIADDVSDNLGYLDILRETGDRRIRVHTCKQHSGIAGTSQYALKMATGEYVALMDQDDELYPDALFAFVNSLQHHEIDYFYSDRDMISPQGKRYMHFFKPGWSPEYLLSCNYATHFEIYKKSLISDIGGFRTDYEGSQDYDLVLRATERTERIYHHPMVLYSWRQSQGSVASDLELKSYAFRSGVKAVKDAVKRVNLKVEDVVENPDIWRGHYRIIWDKEGFSDKKIFFITIGRDEKETNRLKQLFKKVDSSFKLSFISADYNIGSINKALRSINQEGYVFFCDDTVTEIVSQGLIDMLGYLSIDGVDAVGCKFLDLDNKIFNAGISITDSGKVLFSYRGNAHDEPGYGAVASVPRNVSAVFPSFWGCRVSSLKERGYLRSGRGYINSALNYFIEIMRSGKRITCIPYMCLRVDEKKLNFEEDISAFKSLWIREGMRDKYYNPNLSDVSEDYGIKI